MWINPRTALQREDGVCEWGLKDPQNVHGRKHSTEGGLGRNQSKESRGVVEGGGEHAGEMSRSLVPLEHRGHEERRSRQIARASQSDFTLSFEWVPVDLSEQWYVQR